MNTELLQGKPVSERITNQLLSKIKELKKKDIVPSLAAVVVGDNPASHIYVKNKSKFFIKNNCSSKTFILPHATIESDLLDLITKLNNDDKFHGILVQLPLPEHIDSNNILYHIDPMKDVDGFHPINSGYLLAGNPKFIPCTPNGIIKILDYYRVETFGKHVVILGRSNIVGKPMFSLLSQKFAVGNSTVTLCHTSTVDITSYTKQADIIIAAVGVPMMLTSDMIKKGCCIIDVGINRVEDTNSRKGYKLVGDVNSESVMGKARYLTPVPGGVGPMTITMLLYNTVKSAENLLI